MGLPSRTTFVEDTPARANEVNTNFTNVYDALETTAGGQIIVADASGVPRPVAASGHLTIDANGVMTLADNAVTRPKIANGAIDSTKIADASVTNSKLPDGVVNAAKLASGAVTEAKIGSAAVAAAKIAGGAVTSSKIASGAVTEEKIQNSAVTSSKLALSPNTFTTATLELTNVLTNIPGWTVSNPTSGLWRVECFVAVTGPSGEVMDAEIELRREGSAVRTARVTNARAAVSGERHRQAVSLVSLGLSLNGSQTITVAAKTNFVTSGTTVIAGSRSVMVMTRIGTGT